MLLKISSEGEFDTRIGCPVRHKPQITVFTMGFVLVGMMFLIPAITEKALGYTEATVIDYPKYRIYDNPQACCYSHLSDGQFSVKWHNYYCNPTCSPTVRDGYLIWATMEAGTLGGSEKGYIQASIKSGSDTGIVTFVFSNPASGTNTCDIAIVDGPLKKILEPHCSIDQGCFVARFEKQLILYSILGQ